MLHIWLFSKIIKLCPEKIVTLNNVEYKLLNVNNEVKILKYEPGDHFLGVHYDGAYLERTSDEKVHKSMLTIAIFLNEGFGGGHLQFSTLNKAKSLIVGAQEGKGVLFSQKLPHFAGAVHGVKYLLRADVLCMKDYKLIKIYIPIV